MWSFLCSSLIRASTDAVPDPGAVTAVDAISCREDAAGDLVAAAESVEAANKGVARTIAPRRVAAAVVARAFGRVIEIMIWYLNFRVPLVGFDSDQMQFQDLSQSPSGTDENSIEFIDRSAVRHNPDVKSEEFLHSGACPAENVARRRTL